MRKMVVNAGMMAAAAAMLAVPGVGLGADGDVPHLGGPLVAGVCLISRETVLNTSKVGQAVTARLGQLLAAAQAEVDVERKPLAAEETQLAADQAKLKPDDYQARLKSLAERMVPVRAKADLRGREIERTKLKQVGVISQAAQPLIAAIYKAHGCGLLLDRNAVIDGNLGNDLTAEAVKALDAKLTTLAFDREVLPTTPNPAPAPR